MPNAPKASIVIPTRARPGYLDVTLATVMPQARDAGAEVLVVSDGVDALTASIAQRHGAGLISLARRRGLNAARNVGVKTSTGDLVVFLDDDVAAPPGWLEALLTGVQATPDHEVYGGPIRAWLEGGGPRSCGREPPPITTLDRGSDDRDVELVWGANMAIRRTALERVGPFDEHIFGLRGDEEEWERRYAAGGGRIRYVANAGLEHRRAGEDATIGALARAAYGHGRAARRNDSRRVSTPPLSSELRTFAGCLWHTVRRRCAYGIAMAAHSLGRLREAIAERRA